MNQSIQEIQKITTLTPRRGTDFMEITVKHQSREKAILIANTIAELSVVNGRAIMEHRAQNALRALDDEIKTQKELVDQHREQLTSFLKEHDIPFERAHPTCAPSSLRKSFDESLPEKLATESEDRVELSLIQSRYSELKEAYEQSRALLIELRSRQQESRILLKTPRDPVTLHQLAQ